MRMPLAVVAGLRKWFKLVLAQSGSAEHAEGDSIFALELYRLLQAFEFEPEEKVLMTVVEENGSLQGEEGFLKLVREALATSGLEASRFPVGLALSLNANGDVVPVAPSMPFLPAFTALCVGKVKKLRGCPHMEHDGHHRVQFYEKGSFICEKVSEFLCPVLLGNGGVIVIAIPEHRDKLVESFLAQNCPVDRLKNEGRLVMLDACQT
jgi:hypothetical protein